jgi:hypothetical protein
MGISNNRPSAALPSIGAACDVLQVRLGRPLSGRLATFNGLRSSKGGHQMLKCQCVGTAHWPSGRFLEIPKTVVFRGAHIPKGTGNRENHESRVSSFQFSRFKRRWQSDESATIRRVPGFTSHESRFTVHDSRFTGFRVPSPDSRVPDFTSHGFTSPGFFEPVSCQDLTPRA